MKSRTFRMKIQPIVDEYQWKACLYWDRQLSFPSTLPSFNNHVHPPPTADDIPQETAPYEFSSGCSSSTSHQAGIDEEIKMLGRMTLMMRKWKDQSWTVEPDHSLRLQRWTQEQWSVNPQRQRRMCPLWLTRTSTGRLWNSHAFISTLPNLCLDKTSIVYPCWCIPCVVKGIEDKLRKKGISRDLCNTATL